MLPASGQDRPAETEKAPSEQPASVEKTEASGTTRFHTIHEGIAIDVELRNLDPRKTAKGQLEEGDPVRVLFRVTDTATNTPLSEAFPGAWMDLKPLTEEEVGPEQCREKIESFIGGGLLYRAELDLNVYYVLALNDDGTITIVDPLFGFGTTKLLAMIDLPGPGRDWVLTQDQDRVFVSIPKTKQVTSALTSIWKVERNIDLPQSPARMALQKDGHQLWVATEADDAESGVSVIEVDRLEAATHIPTGRGQHDILFGPDDKRAFITNSEDGTVTAIDVATLKKIQTIDVGGSPYWMAFSKLAQTIFVSSVDGSIAVIDPQTLEVVAAMASDRGLGRIRFEPSGRYAFAVNPERNTLAIADASINAIIQTADVLEGPDQVAFSDELAYVRHRDDPTILMIPLKEIGRVGEGVPAVDFPGGHQSFGSGASSLADAIVQAPGASAVLVANPGDKMIYYYKEGMAAPMGSFRNYGRQPAAVMVVDRSLRERRPGEYETVVQMRSPGKYDLALFLDSPRIFDCFPVQVEPNLELNHERLAAKRADVIPLKVDADAVPGQEVTVAFRILDPVTRAPKTDIPDLQALIFLVPGRRQDVLSMSHRGEGVYEVRFQPRKSGIYYVFVSSRSLGLEVNKGRYSIVNIRPKEAASARKGGR